MFDWSKLPLSAPFRFAIHVIANAPLALCGPGYYADVCISGLCNHCGSDGLGNYSVDRFEIDPGRRLAVYLHRIVLAIQTPRVRS